MKALATTTDVMQIVGQMDGLMYLGDTLVKSKMLPKEIATKEAAVAIMLKGRELGVPPMEAFSSINIISGKPTISPQLMIALAERSGQLADLSIEDDGKKCTVTVTRKGRTPFSASYSMEDAAAAGLAGKDNWKKQPKIMRQWRAISAAFRVVFPDVLAGVYIHEEMGAEVDEEGTIVVSDAEIETPPNGNGHEPADEPDAPTPWIASDKAKPSRIALKTQHDALGDTIYREVMAECFLDSHDDIKSEEDAMVFLAALRERGRELKAQTGDLQSAVDATP